MKMSLKFFVAMILCCTVVHAQSPKYRPKYPRPTRPKQEEDQSRRLKTIAEWNQLDFEFPNSSEKDRAIEDGRFIQKNCLPLDVDVQFRGKGNSLKQYYIVNSYLNTYFQLTAKIECL